MSELNEPLVWEGKGAKRPSSSSSTSTTITSKQSQRRRPTCKRGTSILCYVGKDYTPSPGSKTLGVRCWTMDGGMDGEVD